VDYFRRVQMEYVEAGHIPPFHPLEMSSHFFARFSALYVLELRGKWRIVE